MPVRIERARTPANTPPLRHRLLVVAILAELAAERLVHKGVDGLCDADNAGEDDAPSVAVETVGGGDGDDSEQDAHTERCESHVVGGDVLLNACTSAGATRATMPAARVVAEEISMSVLLGSVWVWKRRPPA